MSGVCDNGQYVVHIVFDAPDHDGYSFLYYAAFLLRDFLNGLAENVLMIQSDGSYYA